MTPAGILLEELAKEQRSDPQFKAGFDPEASSTYSPPPWGHFTPRAPENLEQTKIPAALVEGLLLKFLLFRGTASGGEIARQTKLPYGILVDMLREMKSQQLVAYRNSTQLHDYTYELTHAGQERALRERESCTYFGSAPVSFEDYQESIRGQSIDAQHPKLPQVTKALEGLVINPILLTQLGQALNSARALFLYGFPGNGKTTIAQRLCQAFGEQIWIPRALLIDDQIVRIFDPAMHEEVELDYGVYLDSRWVLIKRPTVTAGGELTMENLEMSLVGNSGIVEAPLHMKSNCGTLVIDDFGRQRMSTTELLNRWILPLENRCDYLNLPNGKKICIPFDQLIIFSTNLEPKELVDEAFLRRIPYKIESCNPTLEEFRRVFEDVAEAEGIPFDEDCYRYLIAEHYETRNRSFRYCHPRDLLRQVKSYCDFNEIPLRMSREAMDMVIRNYFVD